MRPERPFLDQIEERQAAAEVRLRDRDHEPQVRLDHLPLREHVAALDALGEIDLLIGGEQRHLADLAQIETERVERRLDRQVELRNHLLVLRGRLLVRRVLVLLALHELDPVIDEIRVEVLDLLLRQLHFLDTRHDLVVGQEALLDAVCYELV